MTLGTTTLIVGMWLLSMAATFFLYINLRKQINNLKKNLEDTKTESNKLFTTITEAFELLSGERSRMIKDVEELKRRIRMYGNETKKQVFQRRNRGQE
jgi:predicted PurR-regulated permease PerM